MANHTKNLSSDTELFASLPPAVAVLIIDVIHAVFSVLNWRQCSKSLLTEILARIAESESYEQTHEDFSAALWSYQDARRRIEKLSRWLAKFKEDMKLSQFDAVKIPKQMVTKTEAGGFKGHPTVYRAGHFWKLFRYVQDMGCNVNLLSLSACHRRAQVRAIVAQWLSEAGAIPIERAKKADDAKPAKPSFPCNCSCPSCAKCAAKPASAPESEPVLSVQIERERSQIREIEETLFNIGASMLNRGNKLSVVDNKLNAVAVAARQRVKAARARKEGFGDDLAPDTATRARGRAALEVAAGELREAARHAEEMGAHKHAAKLADLARGIEEWKIFQNREVAR